MFIISAVIASYIAQCLGQSQRGALGRPGVAVRRMGAEVAFGVIGVCLCLCHVSWTC